MNRRLWWETASDGWRAELPKIAGSGVESGGVLNEGQEERGSGKSNEWLQEERGPARRMVLRRPDRGYDVAPRAEMRNVIVMIK